MGARILLVEDNAANLELVRYLLASAGHTTVLARDGREAIEAAQRLRPDLMLTDLQMPVMDGFELLRHVRQVPSLAEIPVVAITAFSMACDREAVLDAGFSGYISKPIEPETFNQTIDGFLPPELRSAAGGGRP